MKLNAACGSHGSRQRKRCLMNEFTFLFVSSCKRLLVNALRAWCLATDVMYTWHPSGHTSAALSPRYAALRVGRCSCSNLYGLHQPCRINAEPKVTACEMEALFVTLGMNGDALVNAFATILGARHAEKHAKHARSNQELRREPTTGKMRTQPSKAKRLAEARPGTRTSHVRTSVVHAARAARCQGATCGA